MSLSHSRQPYVQHVDSGEGEGGGPGQDGAKDVEQMSADRWIQIIGKWRRRGGEQ